MGFVNNRNYRYPNNRLTRDYSAARALAVSHTEQTFVLTMHNDERVYLAHFATI